MSVKRCKVHQDLIDEGFDNALSAVEYVMALHRAECQREKRERIEAEVDLVEAELSHARELGFEADALVQNLKRWF